MKALRLYFLLTHTQTCAQCHPSRCSEPQSPNPHECSLPPLFCSWPRKGAVLCVSFFSLALVPAYRPKITKPSINGPWKNSKEGNIQDTSWFPIQNGRLLFGSFATRCTCLLQRVYQTYRQRVFAFRIVEKRWICRKLDRCGWSLFATSKNGYSCVGRKHHRKGGRSCHTFHPWQVSQFKCSMLSSLPSRVKRWNV